MSKRFFTFGCSYTKYSYATWSDYIGINFDEYYNYGRGGASNTYIMNKFVEADCKFNFNKDDYVIVMVTGIGRFSYAPKSNRGFEWRTPGDMYENYATTKDPIIKSFVDNMYSEDWAIYSSWIAVKAMKSLLMAKGIPHKFLMAMDNCNYLMNDGSKWGNDEKITLTRLTEEIYNTLDVSPSLDEWVKNKNYEPSDFNKWDNVNSIDGHPTQRMHYEFVKEHFPEFITEKTNQFYTETLAKFTTASQHLQGATFENEVLYKYAPRPNND